MDSAALFVALICMAVGWVGISLIREPEERALATRLFFTAFAVRLAFTLIFYATGLVSTLGGADDTIWRSMWESSLLWHEYGPDPLLSVFAPDNLQHNDGWRYFGTYFYYFLGSPSQMALAFLNGFSNSVLVVIAFKTAREFFSFKASSFVAWVAVFMPGFLIWSALTVKETWLILFEISTFYVIWRLSRQRNPLFVLGLGVLSLTLIVITLSFRFYVAGFLCAGAIITLMSCWAQRPARAAGFGLLTVAIMYLSLSVLGVVQVDLASVTQSRVAELNTFRTNISDASQAGTNSGVTFDFDTTTLDGALLMLGAGSTYLLLSPFPWQINSVGQLAALPDVLLWWWLVFGFILPGTRYCWQRQQAALLSVAAFMLPLFLFYAFIFGNVGLAYRQRAQLMPFLLIVAAAGYEKRQRERRQLGGAQVHSPPREQLMAQLPPFGTERQ